MFGKTSGFNRNFDLQLVPRYEMSRVDAPDGHRQYLTPSGLTFPSVTTIIGKMQDKTGLDKWRDRVGSDHANKVMIQATNRGSDLHAMVEKYVLNELDSTRGFMPPTIQMFKSLLPQLDKIQKIHGVELPLYSETLRTAGTCDLVAQIDDQLTILDHKTSSKPKKTEYIEHYFLQAGAYAIMYDELYGQLPTKLIISIAVENDSPQWFVEDASEWMDRTRMLFADYWRTYAISRTVASSHDSE